MASIIWPILRHGLSPRKDAQPVIDKDFQAERTRFALIPSMARLFRPSLLVLLEPAQWTRICEAVERLVPGELGEVLVISENGLGTPGSADERVATGASQTGTSFSTPRSGVILLTDRAVPPENLRRLLYLGDRDRQRPVPVHTVGLGHQLPGDVVLPPDTPAEAVAEVLRLLAKLARLQLTFRRRRELLRRLRRAVFRDSLTGLLNRRAWPRVVRSAWQRAKRTRQQIVFALFDLDNFKLVNDTLGHRRGDELLRSIGLAARQACRRRDYLFRWGGDEIALVCIIGPNVPVEPIVERVRQRLATKIPELGDRVITASAGVSVVAPGSSGTFCQPLAKIAEEMIQQADEALCRAKSLGGNSVCRFP